MAEVIGVTEVQEMEVNVKLLKAKLEKARNAENTSVACARIAAAIIGAQAKDSFLMTEGSPPNSFHTSSGSNGDSSCCVMS